MEVRKSKPSSPTQETTIRPLRAICTPTGRCGILHSHIPGLCACSSTTPPTSRHYLPLDRHGRQAATPSHDTTAKSPTCTLCRACALCSWNQCGYLPELRVQRYPSRHAQRNTWSMGLLDGHYCFGILGFHGVQFICTLALLHTLSFGNTSRCNSNPTRTWIDDFRVPLSQFTYWTRTDTRSDHSCEAELAAQRTLLCDPGPSGTNSRTIR